MNLVWEQWAKDFLAGYVRAFNTNDGEVISALYNTPCILFRGDGTIVTLSSTAETAAFFQKVSDALKADGCTDWRYRAMTLVPMGQKCALVTIDWDPLDKHGFPIRTWRQSYNLVRTSTGTRILASTFHIE